MRYYSVDELSKYYDEPFDLKSIDSYLKRTSEDDLIVYLNHLKTANANVFIGWVDQWKGLSQILTNGETTIPFKDVLKLSNHSLFSSFKTFISPLLSPQLLKQTNKGQLTSTLQYVVLLEGDTRAVVENSIYSIIKKRFKPIDESRGTKIDENQLVEEV